MLGAIFKLLGDILKLSFKALIFSTIKFSKFAKWYFGVASDWIRAGFKKQKSKVEIKEQIL